MEYNDPAYSDIMEKLNRIHTDVALLKQEQINQKIVLEQEQENQRKIQEDRQRDIREDLHSIDKKLSIQNGRIGKLEAWRSLVVGGLLVLGTAIGYAIQLMK